MELNFSVYLTEALKKVLVSVCLFLRGVEPGEEP